MLKRICRLLLPDERKMGIRVVCAVFLCALLDFAGLAALLPVLFFLLDDGRDKDAALLFCLVAIVFILVKNALAAGLSRFQNHFLMSLYRRLSFSLFTSYYQRGLLFIRSRGSIRLGYEVNYICYAFSLNLLSPLLRMTGELLLVFLGDGSFVGLRSVDSTDAVYCLSAFHADLRMGDQETDAPLW